MWVDGRSNVLCVAPHHRCPRNVEHLTGDSDISGWPSTGCPVDNVVTERGRDSAIGDSGSDDCSHDLCRLVMVYVIRRPFFAESLVGLQYFFRFFYTEQGQFANIAFSETV